MARRSRIIFPNRDPEVLSFGDSSTELRVRIIRTEAEGAFLFLANGVDPDTELNSDDQSTIMVPENTGEVVITDPAGAGPWDLRVVARGAACLVQFTDGS